MESKMSFVVLEIWLIGFKKGLEKLWKFLKQGWYETFTIVSTIFLINNGRFSFFSFRLYYTLRGNPQARNCGRNT